MPDSGRLSHREARRWLIIAGTAVGLASLPFVMPCPPIGPDWANSEGIAVNGPTVGCCGEGEENQDQGPSQRETAPAVVIDQQDYPPSYWQEKRNADQTDSPDLIAHQSMAASAIRLLNLTCWQIYIAIFGTVGIVLALYFSAEATRAAVDANELSREAFVLDQRPWLSVSIEPSSAIEWRGDGWHLDFKVAIKNTGKSPAFGVFVDAKVTPWPPMRGHNGYDFLEDYMAKKRNWSWDGGPTLFPGETIERQRGTQIEQEELTQFMNTPARTSWGMEKPSSIHPYVMGFVGYFSLFQESSHQTFFEFHVIGRPLGPGAAMSPVNGDIPLERIRIDGFAQTARMD